MLVVAMECLLLFHNSLQLHCLLLLLALLLRLRLRLLLLLLFFLTYKYSLWLNLKNRLHFLNSLRILNEPALEKVLHYHQHLLMVLTIFLNMAEIERPQLNADFEYFKNSLV
jgi:hypothetical protein